MPLTVTPLPPYTDALGSAMFRLLGILLTPLLILAIWWLVAGLAGIVRWRPRRAGRFCRCPVCRYDLAGLPIVQAADSNLSDSTSRTTRCPECGEDLNVNSRARHTRRLKSARRIILGAISIAFVAGCLAIDRFCERKGGVYSTGTRFPPGLHELGFTEIPAVSPHIGGWERLLPASVLYWIALHTPYPTTIRQEISGGPIMTEQSLGTFVAPSRPIDWHGAVDIGWIGVEASGELLRRAEEGSLSPALLPDMVDRFVSAGRFALAATSAMTVPSIGQPNNGHLAAMIDAATNYGQLRSTDFLRLATLNQSIEITSVPANSPGESAVLATIRDSRGRSSWWLVAHYTPWPNIQGCEPVWRLLSASIDGVPLSIEDEGRRLLIAEGSGWNGGLLTLRWRAAVRFNASSFQSGASSGNDRTPPSWNGFPLTDEVRSIRVPDDSRYFEFESTATLPSAIGYLYSIQAITTVLSTEPNKSPSTGKHTGSP